MRDFQTQDGIVLRNVPDGVTDEQVKVRINEERAKRGSTVKPDVQTIDQTKGMSDYEKRALDISKSDITGIEKQLQSTALGLEYIYDTAAQEVSEFISDDVKKYLSNVTTSMGNAANTVTPPPLTKAGMVALKEGGEAWGEFEQEYPRWAADVKAVGIIGSTALMGARPAKSLTKKALFKKADYLKDIVTPMKIKGLDLRNMRTEGLRGRTVFDVGANEKQMIKVLDKIPGITSGQTPARSYELIRNYNKGQAVSLREKLTGTGKSVNNKEVRMTLNRAMANFDKQYDKSKRMKKKERRMFMDDALDRIGDPKTTAELLDARQAADKRFRFFSNDRRMKGELIPTREEVKWRSTRDSLNALLEMKEPGYKADIGQQHLMYKSMDILEDKVYKQVEDEGKSFLERHLPKVPTMIMPRVGK